MPEKRLIDAVVDGLREEMARDERVLVFGEDVGLAGGVTGVTAGLYQDFQLNMPDGAPPSRCFDTPLNEIAIAALAIGLSMNGYRPVAEMQFADFTAPAFDQIVNEAARMRFRSNGQFGCPMVIRTQYGCTRGTALYHSQSIEAFYSHVPGLKVVAPVMPYDCKGMLKTAIRDDDPVIFLEHKRAYRHVKEEVPDGDYTVPFGKAKIRREGSDCTIITYGYMLIVSLEAADALAADGVSCEVIDLMSINPLDEDAVLNSVAKTGRAVIVYEDNRFMGFGAEVAAIIAEKAFQHLDAPVTRVAGPFVPGVPFAITLEDAYLPNADKIAAAVKKVVAF